MFIRKIFVGKVFVRTIIFSAAAFFICLQLLAGSTPPRAPAIELYRHRVQPRQLEQFVMLAQNTPPSDAQKPGSSESTASTPTSPAPPPGQSNPGTSRATTPPSQNPPSPARKKIVHKKPAAESKKVVVRDGGAADPSVQFSTTGSPDQSSRQRQDTDGLLAKTTANIQKISGRSLNPSQKDMLTQIHSYMRQAKSAEDAGDLQSAQNLALKAELLSSELLDK